MLGVFGGAFSIVSAIWGSNSGTDEVLEKLEEGFNKMDERFDEVKTKLGEITQQLDRGINTLRVDCAKSGYMAFAADIKRAYLTVLRDCLYFLRKNPKQSTRINNSTCDRRSDVMKECAKETDISKALDTLLEGAYAGVMLQEPVVQLVADKIECGVGDIIDYTEWYEQLAFYAAEVLTVRTVFTAKDDYANQPLCKVLDHVFRLRKKAHQIINSCFKHYTLSDIINKVKDNTWDSFASLVKK